PVVALLERAQELLVALRQRRRQLTLERDEQRSLRRGPPQQHERVVRDADERRRDDADERLVVVAIAQQAEIREQVDHLLLAEVAAARPAIRRDPERAQLLLVPLRVGAGREEQDDLARGRSAAVDQLADAARDRPRFASAPVHPRLGIRGLVGDDQLDRVAEDRVRELARRRQRLELVAEVAAEEM